MFKKNSNRISQGYSCIEHKFWRFENPIEKFKRYSRNLKYIRERAKYGFCERDVWEVDTWFINTIPSMLRHLRDTTQSYPNELADDNQVHSINDEPDEGFIKWQAILTEMIDLFEKAKEKGPKRDEYKDQAFILFSKWFFDLWD